MGAFHAYDIRGIYHVDFDRETAYKIGFFLPELLHTKRMAVGRDGRVSSPEIHEALLAGLTQAGADVYDLGLATTPLVYYATAKHHFDGSVQITASHNGAEYNGFKVSRTDAAPVGYDSGLSLLESWISSRPVLPLPVEQHGRVIPFNIYDEYLAFQRAFLPDTSGLTLCFDLSNGVSSLFIKDLLPPGDHIHYINDTLDGTFPGHDPNPLILKNVAQLQALVREKKGHIGIIFDGDADRVMFVDQTGAFIPPDLIIALLGHYFLKGQPAKVLQDIRSSKAVGEYLTPMGAEMHTWRVGRAFAAPKLKEIDGLFGGELAGHYYFKDFFYSDSGILAALLVLNVLAQDRTVSLSTRIGRIRNYENSGELNFHIDNKQEAMDALRAHFCQAERPTAFYDFDGYRIEFPHWWFNVRPSNTEPYLRFIAEANSPELLQEKLTIMRHVLKPFGA